MHTLGTDRPGDLRPLRLGYFSASAVSLMAKDTGIYRAHGLSVTEDPVPSSTEQMRRLIGGHYDAVLTSPDNVLNYRVNASGPFGRSDLRILAGVDMGLGLSIMGTPGLRTIADLAGKRVGVDVPNSGFAYALYEVLAKAGVPRGEYQVVTMGSTPRRAGALLAGDCDATLLNAGHDLLAEANGAVRLARVSSVLGPYPGTAIAAVAGAVAERPDLYAAFVAAWSEATRATLEPANREQVVSELADGLSAPAPVAQAAYDTVVGRREGLIPDGVLEPAGWRLLVDLRQASRGFDADVDVDLLRSEVPVSDTHTARTAEESR